MHLVRSHTQRTYIASHAVLFWLCVGLFVAGASSLIFPDSVQQSSTSLALPEWLRIGFQVSYTLGAAMALYGLIRGEARVEAAAQMLLGSSFLIDYAAIVHLAPDAWIAGLFIVSLAIGCLRRGVFLVRRGYPPRPTIEKRD